MPGFMSSSTAITICKVEAPKPFEVEALRSHAFTPDIDADGKRFGWVGLGDPLDTDGFALASMSVQYAGFSFRLDTRKASGGRDPAPACRSSARRDGRRQKGQQQA